MNNFFGRGTLYGSSFAGLDGCENIPVQSEIQGIFFLPFGTGVDWTNAASWGGVVNNEAESGGKYLAGIGSVPKESANRVQVSRDLEIITEKRFAINLKVTNFKTCVIENLLTRLDFGYTNFNFWHYNLAGFLFGGASGITPSLVTIEKESNEGAGSFYTGTVRIEWISDRHPAVAKIDNLLEEVDVTPFSSPVFGYSENTAFGYSENDVHGFS